MKYAAEIYDRMKISVLTLGTWVSGGDSWGGSDAQESLKAIRTALDGGVTCIDTAPIYGQGRAETLVGQAIKGRRDNVAVATKCGLITQGRRVMVCLKADSIRAEAEQSLRRLGTDYIDLYQCHWPDPQTPLEETMTALCELQAEGKIRRIGVSNFSLSQLKEAATCAPVFSAQNQLSILNQDIAGELLPYCRNEGVAVLAYGALGGGILTGKYALPPVFEKSDARKFFYKFYEGDAFKKTQAVLTAFRQINRPLNQVAINWVRQQPGVTSVIVGCRTAQQAKDNLAAADWDLSSEEMKKLGRF